jgi:fumarate reductase subunit D
MRYSLEPLLWSFFSAGGVVIALLVPALIVVTGLLVPGEAIEYAHLENIFGHPLVRLTVFGVAALTFLHWANRFRHTLVDMGLGALHVPISLASYGVAAAGTLWAAAVVLG